MAQKARLVLNFKHNNGNVIPGTTIRFNLFYGGSVKQETFYASSSNEGARDFNSPYELARKIELLAPNYTTSVSFTQDMVLTITARYYDDRYNFGTVYSSSSNISVTSNVVNENPVDTTVTILRVDTTPSVQGGSNGSAKIIAQGESLSYRLNSTVYQSSPQFNNLTPGSKTAYATNPYGVEVTLPFTIGSYPQQLKASISSTNVTSNGGSDGSITVVIDSGQYPFLGTWEDDSLANFQLVGNKFTASRNNLSAGDYSIVITDDNGQELSLYATIAEPESIYVEPYLFVPEMNSLRFVLTEDIDNSSVFKNTDNTLFADHIQPGVAPKGYCQKYSQSDIITVQLQSNYKSNFLVVRNIKTSEEVLRIPFERKLQLTNIEESYEGNVGLAYFKGPAVGTTDTTYIYPYTTEFLSSDVVIISGNEYFNGTYKILSRGTNPFTGRDYVEINTPINTEDLIDGSPYVDITFLVNLRPYDIYEASINFGTLNGYYQSIIEATDSNRSDVLYSEPIKVLSSINPFWDKTVMVEYQNEDNAFNIAYSTGILNRLRVEGRFYKAVPGGDTEILRQPNDDIVKVSGKSYKGRLLETYKLPTWMHEKLATVFQHDHILINKIKCQTENLYEIEYTDANPFASGEIALEVLGRFDKGNGHDPGNGMAETGFIIANEGFIKR